MLLLYTNLGVSVDVSVKVPEALEDRVEHSPESIADFLEKTKNKVIKACIKEPQHKDESEKASDFAHLIEDCGRRYIIHCLNILPGATFEMNRLGTVLSDSVELLQFFGEKELPSLDIEIDDGSQKIAMAKGNIAIVPPKVTAYSVRNNRLSPATLYRAYGIG